MRKSQGILWRAAVVLAVAVPALAGCGGGGGGSSTAVYKGSEDPAAITVADADALTAAIVTAQEFNFAPLSSFTKAGGGAPTPAEVLAGFAPKRLHRAVLRHGKAGDGARRALKTTQDCPSGGTLTIEVPSDTATTGTFKQTYVLCDLGDGFRINGTLIDFVTTATDTTNAGTLQMNLTMAFSGQTFRFTADGGYNLDSGTLQDVTTGDFEFWDVTNAVGMRIQDMDLTETFADETDWNDDCALTSAYTMTVFDAVFGRVDLATTSPVGFTGNQCTNPGPSSGGPIVLTGAADGTITLTPLSATQVTVAVDVDADAVAETTDTVLWADLGFL